nr:MAG TPA: Protein of unknown function (DUF3659) [Caudoviricetes sp.]
MKVYDRETKEIIATIIANHSMSIDDVLNLMRYALDEEGQIVDADGELLNAWYDNLEMDWEA